MPERITSIYFQAIGLFTLAIGISMAVKMDHILIIVGSLAIGAKGGIVTGKQIGRAHV